MKLINGFKFFTFLLLLSACSLTSCSVSRAPSLEERTKVKNLIEKATKEIRLGRIEQAKAFVDIAEQLAPLDPSVSDARGCISWYYKDYFAARNYFNTAMLLDPSFENPYVNLAYLEEKRGRVEIAKSLLQKVLKINPLNHKARNNYAALLYDNAKTNSDREQARKEFQMAIGSVDKIDEVLGRNQKFFHQKN